MIASAAIHTQTMYRTGFVPSVTWSVNTCTVSYTKTNVLLNHNNNLLKRTSKNISSWCRDVSMHECTGWQSTQRSAMHTVHNMAVLFDNHPYINNSKFSANWHATATYVGMVQCWIMWPCSGRVYHCMYVCMALPVCLLHQPVHSLSHPASPTSAR